MLIGAVEGSNEVKFVELTKNRPKCVRVLGDFCDLLQSPHLKNFLGVSKNSLYPTQKYHPGASVDAHGRPLRGGAASVALLSHETYRSKLASPKRNKVQVH